MPVARNYQNTPPLVSIIINCYNGEKYLENAITSVFEQTYSHWEIIFWDNQSTDNSAVIFKKYRDERLKYYLAPARTRLYEARNYAIEKSSGEYIAFLDVDDWWLPDKLEKQLPIFSKIGMVCGNHWIVNENKKTKWIRYRKRIPSGNVLDDLLKEYFVGLLTLMIRRDALRSLRIQCNPDYHIIGDFDLVVRLAVGWELGSVQEPVACYRIHDNNESTKSSCEYEQELESWIKEMDKNRDISASKNWPQIKNIYLYIKAMNQIKNGQKNEAFKLYKKLSWNIYKLKLIFGLLAPRSLVLKIKN